MGLGLQRKEDESEEDEEGRCWVNKHASCHADKSFGCKKLSLVLALFLGRPLIYMF